MASRKLVKHGESTFMVSLPKPWVDEHNLQKGDSLEYEEKPNSVTYFTEKRESEEELSIEVDFTELDRSFMMLYLRALYRQGYEKIKINFKEDSVVHYSTGKEERVVSIITEEVNRLIGIEISRHESNSMVLHQLAEPSRAELKSSFRRTFFMLDSVYEYIFSALRNKEFDILRDIEDKHDAITKLVSYCVRLLNTIYSGEKKSEIMHILMQVDVKIDILKYFARNMREEKVEFSEDSLKILEGVKEAHEIEEGLLFSWDNKKANEFDRLREKIKKEYSSIDSARESKHLNYVLPLLEIYRDVVLTRLTMPPGDIFE